MLFYFSESILFGFSLISSPLLQSSENLYHIILIIILNSSPLALFCLPSVYLSLIFINKHFVASKYFEELCL